MSCSGFESSTDLLFFAEETLLWLSVLGQALRFIFKRVLVLAVPTTGVDQHRALLQVPQSLNLILA